MQRGSRQRAAIFAADLLPASFSYELLTSVSLAEYPSPCIIPLKDLE